MTSTPAPDSPPPPLEAEALCAECDPAQLTFVTTDDLTDPPGIVGQDRAVEAIRFGVGILQDGYNMFALGPSGTGKYSVIRQFLESRARTMPTPPDLVYVNNFEDQNRPNLIALPAGQGRRLVGDMEQLIELVKTAIPRAFESEEYRRGRLRIEERFKKAHEELFGEVHREAESHSITILRTPNGLALAPLKDGQIVSPADFEAWPEEDKTHTRAVIEQLEGKLRTAMERLPKLERRVRDKIRELNQGITLFAVGHLIEDMKKGYADLEEIRIYLDQVRDDMVNHVDLFLRGERDGGGEEPPAPAPGPMAAEHGMAAFFNRYGVNLLVDHGDGEGAPVVFEDLPNLQSLIGRIEHIAQFGTLLTDFSLIRAGALHRANGGYLLMDAQKLLQSPFAWEELKRALRSREIRIESPERLMSIQTTITLEPEPAPLDLKVVLLGDRRLYYLLTQFDPEFSELFKVEVDFEESWERTPETMMLFARFLAKVIRHQNLRRFDAPAIARVITFASRLSGDARKMTTHIRSLSDLLGEADHFARMRGSETVERDDVDTAIAAKIRRADRIRSLDYEQISRGTVLIDTDGEALGQVNGLSVLQLGKFPFGRPSRITARVRLGRGQVIDIEREVELGGPLHSKGVLILSGYLGARYCPDLPLSLAASLVFEQSYGGVDGDSASSAELYALLSALSGLPLRQSLAVTGSVNQHGQVQAIGGVNEKIEGFFDICTQRGLTGRQGVLIPAANVQHLMLRCDVIEAVREGRFGIWPIAHVDQGIALLTGQPAGERTENGTFPPDSVNGKVEARLAALAEAARRFARSAGSTGQGPAEG